MSIEDEIDGALHDYAMSADAMRWTPDPPEEQPNEMELLASQIQAIDWEAVSRQMQRTFDLLSERLTAFFLSVGPLAAKIEAALREANSQETYVLVEGETTDG